jgi:formate hydrogenlyase transcriptional activator
MNSPDIWKVLLVDDNPDNLGVLRDTLTPAGYDLFFANSGERAIEIALQTQPDLILLDVIMPKLDGYETSKKLKADEKTKDIPIIFITAKKDTEDIITGFSVGGVDYIPKPFFEEEVCARVKTHLELANLRKTLEQKVSERTLELKEANEKLKELSEQLVVQNEYLRKEMPDETTFSGIIGQSEALKEVLEQVKLVSESDATVLIEGETGTGKELVARAIHENSSRKNLPLIKINCGAISKELFESEFFGHAKGSFTGAIKDRMGRFQLADKGTLFLDEIGEIPIDLQPKLLRVLQEGQFEAVGDDRTRHVDVRIIAATNRDLRQEILNGSFREDLYYRLNVFPIGIPPLKERENDIELIAQNFIANLCKRFNYKNFKLSVKHVESLKNYNWPGNIRELQNLIERALILSNGNPKKFNLTFPDSQNEKLFQEIPKPTHGEEIFSLEQEQEFNKKNILSALETTNWRVYGPRGAAKILGLHPQTLSYRIKKLDIKRP